MKELTVIADPGVDDMLALVLLERLASRQRKLLVSTFGNHRAEVTNKNSEQFAAYMQAQWRYRQGAALPYNKKIERPYPDYFHGSDGLWGVRPPSTNAAARRTETLATDTVFSLGPLTEPYALLTTSIVKQVLVMGGAFAERGNETEFAEFNIAMDVDAAALFFESCREVEVKLVPMDATQKVTWSLTDVRRIPETSTINRWLKQLLLAWFKNYQYATEKSFVLYDPLAVYLAFSPNNAEWKRSGVRVVTGGKERGRTVFSKTNPVCNIAIDIKEPAKVATQIFDILFEENNEKYSKEHSS